MKQSSLFAFVLAALCVVAASVLQGLGHDSQQLWELAFATIAGALGITIPSLGSSQAQSSQPASTSSSSTPSSTAPAASSASAPAASSSHLTTVQ